jgi:hypothetical protein
MKQITVTETHLKLVQNLNIDTRSEVPQISSKRPFGNSSYYDHVLELTGNEEPPYVEPVDENITDFYLTDEGREYVESMLDDIQGILQILTDTLSVTTGTYIYKNGEWQKLSD